MGAQRMTEEETGAVIRLWQAEQAGVADTPTLPDVAEGLDISVEDAQRLLSLVRARRAEEERLLAQEQAVVTLELARRQEEQKLAEVRHQRAELRRERARAGAWRPTQAPDPIMQVWTYPAKSRAFAPAVVTLSILAVVTLALWIIGSPVMGFKNQPEASCTIDNKPVPCSELPISVPPGH